MSPIRWTPNSKPVLVTSSSPPHSGLFYLPPLYSQTRKAEQFPPQVRFRTPLQQAQKYCTQSSWHAQLLKALQDCMQHSNQTKITIYGPVLLHNSKKKKLKKIKEKKNSSDFAKTKPFDHWIIHRRFNISLAKRIPHDLRKGPEILPLPLQLLQGWQQPTSALQGDCETHPQLFHKANCFPYVASLAHRRSKARNTQLCVHRGAFHKAALKCWGTAQYLAGYLRTCPVPLVPWALLPHALLLDYQRKHPPPTFWFAEPNRSLPSLIMC